VGVPPVRHAPAGLGPISPVTAAIIRLRIKRQLQLLRRRGPCRPPPVRLPTRCGPTTSQPTRSLILELDWVDQHRDHRGTASRQFVFCMRIGPMPLCTPIPTMPAGSTLCSSTTTPCSRSRCLPAPAMSSDTFVSRFSRAPFGAAHWAVAGAVDSGDYRRLDLRAPAAAREPGDALPTWQPS
jgi:hypothetical protein